MSEEFLPHNNFTGEMADFINQTSKIFISLKWQLLQKKLNNRLHHF